MCKELLDVILNPSKALEEAKKEKKYVNIFAALLAVDILFMISLFLLGILKFSDSILNSVISFIIMFVLFYTALLVCTFFIGFVTARVLQFLGRKHSIYEGAIVWTYPKLYASALLLLVSILVFLMKLTIGDPKAFMMSFMMQQPDFAKIFILAILGIITLMLAIYTAATWFAYLCRAIKEMFEAEYIEVFLSLLAIYVGFAVLFSLLWFFILSSYISMLLMPAMSAMHSAYPGMYGRYY